MAGGKADGRFELVLKLPGATLLSHHHGSRRTKLHAAVARGRARCRSATPVFDDLATLGTVKCRRTRLGSPARRLGTDPDVGPTRTPGTRSVRRKMLLDRMTNGERNELRATSTERGCREDRNEFKTVFAKPVGKSHPTDNGAKGRGERRTAATHAASA